MAISADTRKDVVYFARTDFRNTDRLFGIKRNDRRQHMYVVGKTGCGKTALLNNLIVQDIANGEGVCVVDPHGELVEGILEKIPEERVGDVGGPCARLEQAVMAAGPVIEDDDVAADGHHVPGPHALQ